MLKVVLGDGTICAKTTKREKYKKPESRVVAADKTKIVNNLLGIFSGYFNTPYIIETLVGV